MVFGFFSRKQRIEPEAGPSTQFQFPQRQSHPPGPEDSPSPPPDTHQEQELEQELVTDSADLHTLIASVPPQTLYAYTLAHLSPVPPSPLPQELSSTTLPNPINNVEPPSPRTLTVLTKFFSTLTPPPKVHCVRCHNTYFELENNDRACHIPHDDDSATVGRVRKGNGGTSEYETLFGCCGKTVEGDGDMGPPDGWCYEGFHTTDPRRARFRADSTVHDDKLIPCSTLRCGQPPLPARSSRSRASLSRKRSRPAMEVDEDTANEIETDDDVHSVVSSTQSLSHKKPHSKSTPVSKIANANRRRSLSNASSALSQTKGRKRKIPEMEEEEESTDPECQRNSVSEAGPSKPKPKRRTRKITSPAEVHSEEEEGTNDEANANEETSKRPTKRPRARKISVRDSSFMDVDQDIPVPTPPRSPKRNSKKLPGTAIATSTKPLQSSPLAASYVLGSTGPLSPELIQRPESPTPLPSSGLSRKLSARKLEVAVELVARSSPNKVMGPPSAVKAIRVKDKVMEIEKGTVKRKMSGKTKNLGELVATSVDGEGSGVWS